MGSTVRVGLRRLYQAHGCELEANAELRHEFQLGENYSVSVIIGSKPQFGLWTGENDSRYLVLGISTINASWKYEPDIEKTHLADRLLTEIVVSRLAEIGDELHAPFEAKESAALNSVLSLAEDESLQLAPVMEFVAGMIGLRVHRQFVAELLNENPVTWRSDGPQIQFASRMVEALNPLMLTDRGQSYLKAHFDAATPGDRIVVEAGRILGWLHRAWAEFDFMNRFLWLFIPIECALARVKIDNREQVEHSKAIRRLINNHGEAEKDVLLSLFNRMAERTRPSLEERFAALATESGCATFEADIRAFREFNRIRNGLMHRGEQKVRLHVGDPGKEQVSGLQDIAERYVSYALFGDFRVYSLGGRQAK
jgi:hypothetical protein